MGLMDSLKEVGMQVVTPKGYGGLITFPNQGESVEDVLKRAHGAARTVFQAPKVDMVFCVLVGKQNPYADIKRYAEAKLNIMTQCLLDKHVRDDVKKKNSYFLNIALKINAKLGGINAFLNPKVPIKP